MFYCCFLLFRFFFFESCFWGKGWTSKCFFRLWWSLLSGGKIWIRRWIRLVAMAEMHVVNFSSTIVMSLVRLFGGAMKRSNQPWSVWTISLAWPQNLKITPDFTGHGIRSAQNIVIAFEPSANTSIHKHCSRTIFTSLTEYYGFDLQRVWCFERLRSFFCETEMENML